MSTPLSQALAPLIEAAGFSGKGGTTRLHRLLVERHGIQSSLQSTSYWLRGDRTPRLPHLMALLDALVVVEPQRGEIMRLWLASQGLEQDDIDTVESSP